jgi:glycosyltransferase involved in cell wall biosynthesis
MTADAVGGVWQYATDLAAALRARGHTVTLAVLGPAPTADQRENAQRIPGLRLVETGLPLDWLSAGPGPVERAAEAIAALVRAEGADLIHCNMPTLAGAADFPVPVVAVTHGCIATWWQAAKTEPLLASYRWHKRMMARGLAAADVVVAPSASYAAIVRRTYRLPAAPLVVHNGRAPLPAPPLKEPPLHAALTVGRLWDPVKNAAMLDRIAGRLPMPFLAAGAVLGPHGELIKLDHLEVLGQLDAAPLGALLARRPVFVSAASFEPFGLSVLEAAQAGCPLVVSDTPTFRELWDGAALFVPPGEEESFAAAIERLAADRTQRAQLGTKAAQRAARYTPAAKAAAMMRIYEGLLVRQKEQAA